MSFTYVHIGTYRHLYVHMSFTYVHIGAYVCLRPSLHRPGPSSRLYIKSHIYYILNFIYVIDLVGGESFDGGVHVVTAALKSKYIHIFQLLPRNKKIQQIQNLDISSQKISSPQHVAEFIYFIL